ncbi:T9SS type A sorting domain-containing protein [Dokdonia sp.]|uniref:T9SS type A sorting domain-containing protein n=1 Tax=Dokdonia sp. TaxID=2024995 RepID=UPI003263B3E3
MKNLLIVVLTTLSFTANAQLYVQPTTTDASYIYVNDTFIYVEEDVELTSNSTASIVTQRQVPNIALRNGSQLLQGNGADQLSKGNGDISIYQEGTTNQWDYNLWASPVGVALNDDGTTRADGNGIFAFRDATTSSVTVTQQVFYVPTVGGAGVEINSNPVLIGPGLNGSSGPSSGQLSIASFWIYGYEAGNSTAEFINVQSSGSLPAGLGFTMKGVNGTDTTVPGIGLDATPNNAGVLGDGLGQRIDFKGRPNNGTITATVLPDTQTITGNPYPSALDLNYFLLLNSNSGTFTTETLPSGNTVTFTGIDVTEGVAYFWDSDPTAQTHFVEQYQAGYGMYSPMGLLATDGMYVAAQYQMYDEAGNPIVGSETGVVGADYDRRFSPVGQGFMVTGSALQTTDTFTFTNDMRIFVKEGNNSDFRTNEETSDNEVVEAIGVGTYYEDINNFPTFTQFKIGININDTYGRELGVGILDHATRGYDTAMDGKSAGAIATDISFSINEEDQFVINAVPDDEYQALQLSITADTPSEFRFRARDIQEFNYEGIFLFDTLTEIYYDIQTESILISLDAGEYPKRFEIRFTREVEENTEEETEEEEEETEEEEEETEEEGDWEEEGEWEEEDETLTIGESVLESFTIFQNNSASQLEIRNPNSIELTNVTLFDLTGKQLFFNQDLGTKAIYTFPTHNLSTGIYVVTFVTEGGFTKARKISITNK